MEKVLLLSCSTGQGHNSCADAIREVFEEHGVTCEVQDALDFISPVVAKVMSRGHSWIYRHCPGLFRWGYRYSEQHPGVFEERSGIYQLLTAGTDRMSVFVKGGGYDTIICTHVLTAMMLTRMLRDHPMEVRTLFVATDYTCSPSLEASDLQRYYIPDESLTEEFAKCGIPRERMTAVGIPVRQGCFRHTDKADAKRLLGVNPRKQHLLMMCGSMGCGPMGRLLALLAEMAGDDAEISVICGTNRKLQRRLQRKYRKNDSVHIVGYTSEVPLYMDSADLYLTKPGGISVTEAAAKGLPMAFVNAVAGCESYNMKFFMERGGAVTADTPEGLAAKCAEILRSPAEREAMARAMRGCRCPDGAGRIYQELTGEIAYACKRYG